MKKGNVTILASVFAMLLVAGAVGAGTTAWFSTTETANVGQIKAGTFKFSSITMTASIPSNWVPGEEFTVQFTITNAGTTTIPYIATDWIRGAISGPDLSNVIEVVSYEEHVTGVGWFENIGGAQAYETQVVDYSAPLTLKELICSYWDHGGGKAEPMSSDPGGWVQDQFGNWVSTTTDALTGMGYDAGTQPNQPALPVGGTYSVKLKLKFMTSAGNAYQGATLSFSVKFTGVQDPPSQLP